MNGKAAHTWKVLTAAQMEYLLGRQVFHGAPVDLDALGSDVRWESARGGDLFPHIYAPLPLAAVGTHGPLLRQADGSIVLPDQT